MRLASHHCQAAPPATSSAVSARSQTPLDKRNVGSKEGEKIGRVRNIVRMVCSKKIGRVGNIVRMVCSKKIWRVRNIVRMVCSKNWEGQETPDGRVANLGQGQSQAQASPSCLKIGECHIG